MSQTKKIQIEIAKLNRYIEIFNPTITFNKDFSENPVYLEIEKLEQDSKLVRKVRPLLTQRSYSLERLTLVEMSQFSKQERDRCFQLMEIEEAKIRAYLNIQEAKRQEVEQQADILALCLEGIRVQNDARISHGLNDEDISQQYYAYRRIVTRQRQEVKRKRNGKVQEITNTLLKQLDEENLMSQSIPLDIDNNGM